MTLLQRWTAFNLVGLSRRSPFSSRVLALLVHACGWNYLAATALAVEAAVLHNFAWHQRWTWKDRRAASARETWRRLRPLSRVERAVSLAGNVAITAALVRLAAHGPRAGERHRDRGVRARQLRRKRSAGVPIERRRDHVCSPSTPSTAQRGARRGRDVAGWQHYQSQVEERFPRGHRRRHRSSRTIVLGHAGWREEVMSGTASA